MIIDAHAHADEFGLFGWFDPPEKVIELMDKAGIDLSIVTTYAEAPAYPSALENLRNYLDKYPDRLLGFIRIDPKGGDKALEVFEQAVTEHPLIKGMKLHPISNLIKPYSPFCTRLLKKAAELDVPVFFHCGDKVLAQPLQIGKAAEICPETTIICHIGGFFHGEEAIRMARRHQNIILDTSSIPYPNLIVKAVGEIGPDRVVFASDNPAGDPISELAKIRNLNFDQETEEKILYRNIANILNLDLEEEK